MPRLPLLAALLGLLVACDLWDTPRARDRDRDRRADPRVLDHRKARGDREFETRRRAAAAVPRDKPETVVLVVMDTVRADHLSLCGYDRPTSPYLEHMRDSFGAAWSCSAYAPATWTLPSHTSFFTGKDVPDHGHDRLGGVVPADLGPTLADQLAARGYETVFFSANPALARSGLQQGFGHVRIAADMAELRQPDMRDALAKLLAQADGTKPWFVFVNLVDAHDPYPAVPRGVSWVGAQEAQRLDYEDTVAGKRTPYATFMTGRMDPTAARRYLSELRDGYDWGVNRADEGVRDVITLLHDLGRTPGPLRVVVTADHGEFLGEHGLLRHASYVWEPVVRVPFLYLDNLADTQVTLPDPLSATTAFQLVRDGRLPEPALPVRAWSRVMPERPVKPGEDMIAEWRAGAPKLVWRSGVFEAYDLVADPAEASPTGADAHPARAAMTAEVARFKAHLGATATAPLDPEAVEILRRLGYLQAPAAP